MAPKRKRNRRKSALYPALNPQLNLKSRQDLIDYDYLDKLSPEELDWLNRFTEESVNANFNHDGKIIHKDKKGQRRSLRKLCYDANNARNNDVYLRSKISGQLLSIEESIIKEDGHAATEDDIIAKLDKEFKD